MMDKADRQATLERLEQVGEDLLKQINPQEFAGEAVNWGSLHVVEARWVVTTCGDYYEIVVDEVAPEARRFASYVETLYGEAGYDVQVVTEW